MGAMSYLTFAWGRGGEGNGWMRLASQKFGTFALLIDDHCVFFSKGEFMYLSFWTWRVTNTHFT